MFVISANVNLRAIDEFIFLRVGSGSVEDLLNELELTHPELMPIKCNELVGRPIKITKSHR